MCFFSSFAFYFWVDIEAIILSETVISVSNNLTILVLSQNILQSFKLTYFETVWFRMEYLV